MDLKFRSDILGRSVLFMGYSFRDLNIRVIWYRLMRMMKDIHPADLPISYIVIVDPNPVLELLYREVGIRTIVLDPRGAIKPGTPNADGQRSRLFAEFMLDLAECCSPDAKIPGQDGSQYVSIALFERIAEALARASKDASPFTRQPPADLLHAMQVASSRRIPVQFAAAAKNCLGGLADSRIANQYYFIPNVVRLALSFLRQVGHDQIVTFWIARGLGSAARDAILAGGVPWKSVWSQQLDEKQAKQLLAVFKSEIDNHRNDRLDADIAYLADVATRIRGAQIVAGSLDAVRRRRRNCFATRPNSTQVSPR